MKRPAVQVTLLFAASLLLYLLQLGSPALWDNSEPTYAEIAREILATGDWVTMHFAGNAFFVHPPLYFWLTALAIKFFGLSETVVRFWAAVFGAGGIVATYWLGRRLYDHRTGLVGAIVLLATLEYMVLCRIVLMDTMLNFFTVLALLGFFHAYQSQASRGLLLFYAAAAMAILAKGPIGLALPVLVIVPFLVARRDLGFLRRFLYWPGLVAFLAIVSPWYAWEIARHGEAFLVTNIAKYTFTRYVGVVEGQPGPIYYYVVVLLAGFFPWVAFLPWVLHRLWKERSVPASLFLLVGVGVIFVFFSLSGTKQPNYIVTFLPLAAVATGHFFKESAATVTPSAWNSRLRRGGLAAALLAAASIIAGYLAVPSLPRAYAGSAIYLLPLGVTWLAGTLLFLLVLRARPGTLLPFGVLASSCVVFFIYVIFAFLPEIERYKFTRPFAQYIAAHPRPGAPTLGYGFLFPSTVYYSRGTATEVDASQLRGLMERRESFYLVTDEPHYSTLAPSPLTVVQHVGKGILAVPEYGSSAERPK